MPLQWRQSPLSLSSDCVKRAYKGVIVPPYSGGEQIMDWDLVLKDEKPAKGDPKAKKKK